MSLRKVPDTTALLQACEGAECVHRGPLNVGYRVVTAELGAAFVRLRLVHDEQYGQTFAAERYLEPASVAGINIPSLLAFSDEPAIAAFEWIDGSAPNWTSSALRQLASALARLHENTGAGFGDIAAPKIKSDAPRYLWQLFRTELHRARSAALPADLAHNRTAQLRKLFDIFVDEVPRLVHGDIHAGNLLQDKSGLLWLLDWEAARYRVAASDFNQAHTGWLTAEQDATLLTMYCCLTDRNEAAFRRQVQLMRALWHLRTFNFTNLVLRSAAAEDDHHLLDASEAITAASST